VFASYRNYENLPSSRRVKFISGTLHSSNFSFDFQCQVSIDNEAAYGLVLQREISLFRDSRDGVDIEIGAAVKSVHGEPLTSNFILTYLVESSHLVLPCLLICLEHDASICSLIDLIQSVPIY
jgi:hypothetical protein